MITALWLLSEVALNSFGVGLSPSASITLQIKKNKEKGEERKKEYLSLTQRGSWSYNKWPSMKF
jgi:hypothetical protein